MDAATRQLVGDLRRAHSSATNQLTDWRVVLALERAQQEEGSDYYLVRLAEPYDPGDPGPTVKERLPRTFPGNVKVTNVITPAGSMVDDQGASYRALRGRLRCLLPSPSRARLSSTRTGR